MQSQADCDPWRPAERVVTHLQYRVMQRYHPGPGSTLSVTCCTILAQAYPVCDTYPESLVHFIVITLSLWYISMSPLVSGTFRCLYLESMVHFHVIIWSRWYISLSLATVFCTLPCHYLELLVHFRHYLELLVHFVVITWSLWYTSLSLAGFRDTFPCHYLKSLVHFVVVMWSRWYISLSSIALDMFSIFWLPHLWSLSYVGPSPKMN